MKQSEQWHNEHVVLHVCLERVELKSLPMLIGRHPSLDKRIAEILQTMNPAQVYWFYNPYILEVINVYHPHLIALDLPSNLAETEEIEAEVEGSSSGYYSCGNWHTAPEHEDERDIECITLTCYGNGGEKLDKIVVEGEKFSELSHTFSIEFYQQDLKS